jgi:DNA repair protein RadC
MIIYESKQTYVQVGIIDHDKLDQTHKVIEYMKDAFLDAPLQEQLWVIMLNRKNMPIARERCSIGTVGSCLVNPSIVFRPAILANASGIILCHNHPSGDPTPSSADMEVTKQIRQASIHLDIYLIDHVIVADGGHYSFMERGLIDL